MKANTKDRVRNFFLLKASTVRNAAADDTGSAMVIALLIMILLMAFVALAVSRTNSETMAASNDEQETLAFEAAIAREVYNLVAGRVSCQVVFRTRALSLGKNAKRTSDIRVVDLFLSFALHLFKFEESRSLVLLGNVIMKLGRRSACTSRIFEDVKTVVLTLFNQIHRLLKILVRFTRKTDDDVTGKSQAPARILYTLNSFEVVTSFVTATHEFEDAIAARLDRQVNPIAQIRVLFDG